MEQSQHVLKRALQEADWIKDEYLKALALSDIAAVLVKVDVGRAGQVFQEALRVAAGIEVEFDKENALRYIAPALATVDVERAVTIADGINNSHWKVLALTGIAGVLLDGQGAA